MLNKKWRQKIIDTEYISERAISTTIMVNHQRIKLMSVYFLQSVYADHHVEKMYRTIQKHTNSSKKSIQIVGGDFNAELWPGYGVERTSVGPPTLNRGNKRGDWLKHWLMIQNFTALNTIYRKTFGKQTTYRSPKGMNREAKRLHFDQEKTPEIQ